MAQFIATGKVLSVVQRGKGSVVGICENEGSPPLEIYCFGTAPKIGQNVICSGSLSGREWKGKIYPDIKSSNWGISISNQDQGHVHPAFSQSMAMVSPDQQVPAGIEEEDIPF